MVTLILNGRLMATIQFHEMLCGFCTGKVTGTTSIESNLIQQMMDMREEVLYEKFLDLHKACDSLDRNCCLNILAAYRIGLRALCLLIQ